MLEPLRSSGYGFVVLLLPWRWKTFFCQLRLLCDTAGVSPALAFQPGRRSFSFSPDC
jgi:hypothetical protein